jgi:hypothetical protein
MRFAVGRVKGSKPTVRKKKTCKTKIAQERIMMDGKNLISSLL